VQARPRVKMLPECCFAVGVFKGALFDVTHPFLSRTGHMGNTFPLLFQGGRWGCLQAGTMAKVFCVVLGLHSSLTRKRIRPPLTACAIASLTRLMG
jgi:hypothetical protein